MIASKSVLSSCISPPSFWSPIWMRLDSGWLEHAPFAFWLVDALRPRLIVELGRGCGCSFAAFCQAVKDLNIDCRCYGIERRHDDGDQMPADESAFRAISDQIDLHYKSFARLIRLDCESVQPTLQGQSVDLLHIDSDQTYDELRADYMSWRPHLARSAIVLIHNINAPERNPSAARLWNELCTEHRHFQFLHRRGLGVLGVGDDFSEPIEALFRSARDADAAVKIRYMYTRLGSIISNQASRADLEAYEAQIAKLELTLGQQLNRVSYLTAVKTKLDTELKAVRAENSARVAELQKTNDRISSYQAEIGRLNADIDRLNADLAAQHAQSDGLQAEIGALMADLQKINADVAAYRAELGRLNADGDSLNADLAAQRAQSDGLRAEIGELHRQIAERAAKMETLQRERDSDRRQWQSMLTSWSWRVAAPLRAMSKIIARVR